MLVRCRWRRSKKSLLEETWKARGGEEQRISLVFIPLVYSAHHLSLFGHRQSFLCVLYIDSTIVLQPFIKVSVKRNWWEGASNRLQKNRLRWGCRNSLHSEQKLASASRLIRGESSNAEKSQRFEFDLLERLISRSPRDLIWEYNLKTLPPMFSWNSGKQSAHPALFRRKKLWDPHSQLFKFIIASFSAYAAFDRFVSLLNCRKWYRLLYDVLLLLLTKSTFWIANTVFGYDKNTLEVVTTWIVLRPCRLMPFSPGNWSVGRSDRRWSWA